MPSEQPRETPPHFAIQPSVLKRYPTAMAIPHASIPHPSLLIATLGALGVLAWRIREGRRAVTSRSIVIPPLGMATGLVMFFVPAFRVKPPWALVAFALGALVFAYPLLRTSSLSMEGNTVMMRRSSSFFLVIIALAIVRLAARGYIGAYVTIPQTASLSFLLALGMIVRWRAAMYLAYRRLTNLPRSIPSAPMQQ